MKFNPFTFRKHVEAAKELITNLKNELVQQRVTAAQDMATLTVNSERRLAKSLEALEDVREKLVQVTTINTTRQRIGSIRLDPKAFTASLRRVVPSVWMEQEGPLFVVYTSQALPEGDFNRVRAEIQSLLEMDRT